MLSALILTTTSPLQTPSDYKNFSLTTFSYGTKGIQTCSNSQDNAGLAFAPTFYLLRQLCRCRNISQANEFSHHSTSLPAKKK
jgi:hypothetical protein